MWQIPAGRIARPVRKLAIGSMTTVGVSALGVALLLPAKGPVAMDVEAMAAIDESNSTLGFADSDMFGLTPEQVDLHLDQMQAMGVNDVRIMIPWAAVEFYEDQYDFSMVDYMVQAADERGMGILAVLNSSPYWAVPEGQPGISGQPEDPADYAEFVGLVAERYEGQIGAYEIWNEPNSALSFAPSPDPVAYTELLQAAYPVIKAADPDAIVVGGVTGAVVDYGDVLKNPVSFTQEMYDAGAQGYFDALSFHPYLYSLPFSQGEPYPQSPLTQLEEMREIMVANGDGDKLIWASEYGEPTSVVDEATQAAFLEDMITTWRDLDYTGPTFVYTLYDRDSASSDPEATLGVIRSDGTWKPAAYVIEDLADDPATMELAASMTSLDRAAPTTDTALTTQAVPVTGPLDPAAVPEVETVALDPATTETATVATPTEPTEPTESTVQQDVPVAPAESAEEVAPSPTAEGPTTADVTTADESSTADESTAGDAADTSAAESSTGSTDSTDGATAQDGSAKGSKGSGGNADRPKANADR